MFKNFKKFFHIKQFKNPFFKFSDNLALDFIKIYDGKTFDNGLFRVIKYEDVDKWKEILGATFIELQNDILPFAYDWLGRFFISIMQNGNDIIYLADIGADELLEIPCGFLEFIEEEIPENANACLAIDFFEEWLDNNRYEIPYKKCVGYKTPLFIGGDDDLDNLELMDLEVYWITLSEFKTKL